MSVSMEDKISSAPRWLPEAEELASPKVLSKLVSTVSPNFELEPVRWMPCVCHSKKGRQPLLTNADLLLNFSEIITGTSALDFLGCRWLGLTLGDSSDEGCSSLSLCVELKLREFLPERRMVEPPVGLKGKRGGEAGKTSE